VIGHAIDDRMQAFGRARWLDGEETGGHAFTSMGDQSVHVTALTIAARSRSPST
jgi:hypothetical protein